MFWSKRIIGVVALAFVLWAQTAEAQVPGACCMPSGECVVTWYGVCLEDGGFPEGSISCEGVVCAAPDIPTVFEWGLVAMTLLVLAAGTVVLTRRRVTAT